MEIKHVVVSVLLMVSIVVTIIATSVKPWATIQLVDLLGIKSEIKYGLWSSCTTVTTSIGSIKECTDILGLTVRSVGGLLIVAIILQAVSLLLSIVYLVRGGASMVLFIALCVVSSLSCIVNLVAMIIFTDKAVGNNEETEWVFGFAWFSFVMHLVAAVAIVVQRFI